MSKITTSAIATPINVIIEICKINDVNKCFVVIPIAFKIPISDVFVSSLHKRMHSIQLP